MATTLTFQGCLIGHQKNKPIQAIASPNAGVDSKKEGVVATASADGKIIVWDLALAEETHDGKPFKQCAVRSMTGHNNQVSSIVLSNDGNYLLSGSNDCTLRLWALPLRTSFRTFVGHKRAVTCVGFSADNRQIFSGGYDGSVRLWNTLGDCKAVMMDPQAQTDVTAIAFSPVDAHKFLITGASDGLVRMWNFRAGQQCTLSCHFAGHKRRVNCVAISPDGSLCASGCQDGIARLWDVSDPEKSEPNMSSLNAGGAIHTLCFSPCHYWLCAAAADGIHIWDLENRKSVYHLNIERVDPQLNNYQIVDYVNGNQRIVAELPNHIVQNTRAPWIKSIAWSPSGNRLYAGGSDGLVYVFNTSRS